MPGQVIFGAGEDFHTRSVGCITSYHSLATQVSIFRDRTGLNERITHDITDTEFKDLIFDDSKLGSSKASDGT
ncbi:hypothetical protein McaMca56_000671 [Microsporum canis]